MIDTLTPKTIDNSKSLWLLLISLLLIGSGIYVLFNPITALVASAIFIGVILIVLGASYLMAYRERKTTAFLALGILDIMVGILFLTNIGISAANMPLIFGLWILFNAVAEIAMGIDLRNSESKFNRILLIGGILGLIFSVLVLAMPVVGTLTITLIIGLYLIVYGGIELTRFIKAF